MSEFSNLQIDLRQMILSLETAIDLVGMNDTNHGKRVGYIASQLAHQMGFSEAEKQFAFDLGLIHDCGVSTEQVHSSLVNYFDWEDAHIHCEIGYQLLRNFKPLQDFALPILHHHTHWNELKDLDIDIKVKRMASLIFLADRIDITASPHYDKDILIAKKEISNIIVSHKGTYFNPEMVEAFLTLQDIEAFWIALEDRNVTRYTWDMGKIEYKEQVNLEQLKKFSLIMSYIVDRKSAFTAQHSIRVGCLAKYLAKAYGLAQDECEKLEIAGFLHDIGKLRVPDDILNKAGPLNTTERSLMNRHSYETFEILRNIKGIEDITHWAAYHHEGINGVGYPFHPNKQELDIQSRILSMADVFQALIQARPYREGMNLDNAFSIIEDNVLNGKLDAKVFQLLKEHSDIVLKIARGEAEENKESEFPFFSTGILDGLKERSTR